MDPGFVNYPRQVKRELTFDCIGEAWRIFRENAGVFVLNGLMILLSTSIPVTLAIIAMLPTFLRMGNPENMADMFENMGVQLALQGLIYVVILVGYLAAGPFMASATKMTLLVLRGQKPQTSDVFYGWRNRPLRFAGIAFLAYLGVLVGSMCCYIPGFIWGGLTMFSMSFAIDEDLGTIAAMRRSWDCLKPHILMASVLYLVLSIISSIGMLACFVGILVTMPLFYIAMTVLYDSMTRPAMPATQGGYSPPPSANWTTPTEGGSSESPKL